MTSTACYALRGVLVAETQLHIGSGMRTGVIKHTRQYVPGSFVRGAFGLCLLKLGLEGTKLFSSFGDEDGTSSDIFFRHAYPMHLGCGGTYLPAPKTLFRCRNPQCGKVYDTFSPPYSCEVPGCDGTVRQVSGFRCSKCGDLKERPLNLSRVTLTSVDRRSQSYAEIPLQGGEVAGTLHVIEAVERGSKFSFEVLIDASCSEELEKVTSIIERCLPDEGIGGSKSRGAGKVRFDRLTVEEIDEEKIQSRADEIDTEGFSVTLVSPMMLDVQRGLKGTTLLEACRRAYTWCFKKGKPELPELTLEASRQSLEAFSGWSLKSGRRRRVEPAISAGSSYLFSSKKDQVLSLCLAALEYSAIGSYKPHGHGQIVVGGRR